MASGISLQKTTINMTTFDAPAGVAPFTLKEFTSEASNGFGQWLSLEDAERVTKSCNPVQARHQRINESQQHSDEFISYGELLYDMEAI